jgi:RNA methyltransferase, TrmH family
MAQRTRFSHQQYNEQQHSAQSGTGLPYPVLAAEMLRFTKTLHEKKIRLQEQLYLAEGEKLVAEALASQTPMEAVIIAQSAGDRALEIAHKCSRQGYDVFQTGPEKFNRIATAQTPQGIMAVVAMPEPDERLWQSACILALDGVSDPGNVGTIIRTAEWFGVRDVLLSADCADIYNPKTVRATMGSIFRCRIHSVGNMAEQIAEYKKYHDVRVLGAELLGTKQLSEVQWKTAHQIILVLGSEAHGISSAVRTHITESIVIEGTRGIEGAESLNVSMSAGILLYQRFLHIQ